MNDLETQIMRGAVKAQKIYERLSGGYWLGHAAESFLQTIIALQIGTLGYSVYVDASLKKIAKDVNRSQRGGPSTNARQRPDISVWTKADNNLMAVIEVKMAWSPDAVSRDGRKLAKYMRQKAAAKMGYIIKGQQIHLYFISSIVLDHILFKSILLLLQPLQNEAMARSNL
jgi:hypothetical protein